MVRSDAELLLRLAELTLKAFASTEILDFGYPQNSESDTLKMYITTEGVKSEQAVVRRGSAFERRRLES